MEKGANTAGEWKEQRRRRKRRYEQERIGEIEQELELARLRVRLYTCAIGVAGEEMASIC